MRNLRTLDENAGIRRKGLQKALSENGNPQFEGMAYIMQAMGYLICSTEYLVDSAMG